MCNHASVLSRFIGELFKLRILSVKIMHQCIIRLLKDDDEESLECLCRLLSTIGKELETPMQPTGPRSSVSVYLYIYRCSLSVFSYRFTNPAAESRYDERLLYSARCDCKAEENIESYSFYDSRCDGFAEKSMEAST